MRKRLIEKFTKAKEGSFGYTMTELLVVVAIIAIVAAIAIPSVIAISRALKFKRVNDHAKSIFLAAQQNLTEMRSDGGLKPLRSAGGSVLTNIAGFPEEYKTEYLYTSNASANTAFELILPAGSVDGTVRAEQIIIEYNPITGNVYSVFYSEEDESILGEYQSQDGLPRNADGDKSRRKDMMLGYYDGSGLNSSQLEIEESQAMVEFVNGEEGIVRVLVPVPDDYFSNVNEYAQALKIDLTITGEYSMLHGVQGAAETGGEAADPSATTGGTAATVPAVTIEIKNFGTGLSENVYVEYGNVIVVEYPIDSLMDKSSFANYAAESRGSTLTNLMDESSFKVLPGENVTIQADVEMDSGSGDLDVVIEPGILSSVNPMFDFLQPSGDGGYILAVSNGRNLQNLNAIAPTIAELVEAVVFTDDIYWNKTVTYYNDVYGNGDNAFSNLADEAPARALPYFVPIHNENLFGTAKFIFPGDGDGGLGGTLEDLREFFDKIGEVIFGGFNNPKVPTLTDEMDAVNDAVHASIQGNGHKVYNLNIDSNAYVVPHDVEDVETATDAELAKLGKFYAVGENQVVDYYFTGLFGYVNTPIENLHVVNPIIKGHAFDDGMKQVAVYKKDWWGRPTDKIDYYETHYQYNNPATGALVGACGYNTVITSCSTYIDRDPASGYVDAYLTHGDFAVGTVQKWYGVSGEGAVGGLVGYAKSHRAVNGELTNNKDHLAFSNSFAAVAVSGNMRKLSDASTNASGSTNSANPTGKDFGYSNGVGAFIGNSQLTNFYNCYASGDVKANNSVLCNTLLGDIGNSIKQAIDGWGVVDLDELYGGQVPDLLYNGRTSWGAGGFVGTSHGTCYTNCFATGDISTGTNVAARGAGGFVGVMSIDETSAYGNDVLDEDGEVVADDEKQIAQRSIFSSCYAVGLTTANGVGNENFSGGNGRIVYDPDESFTSFVGDYYRLYAVYYDIYKAAPQYANSTYYYRDTYFLNYGRYTGDTNNATVCGASEGYETLQNLPAAHSWESSWAQGQLKAVKRIPTLKVVRNGFLNWDTFRDYDSAYFQRNDGLENLYYAAYDQGYSPDAWESPADDDYAGKTYPYTLSGSGAVYPFSKLEGLDYYGDWPAKPSGMGMAYYEIYNGEDENIHYIFDKERDTDIGLSLTKEENDIVTKDGFAIFSVSKQNLNVKVGDKTFANLTATTDEFNIEGKKYYAFLLPDEALNVKPAQDEFYVKVTAWQDNVRDENGNIISFIMYFNPDVALSHANPSNGASAITKPTTAPKTIYVRSARQFRALSTLQNCWTQDYRYIQQLNIDATQYDGWKDADRLVASIGNAQKKFDASYTAAYTNDLGVAKQHSITGFQFANNASGFFGVIGENGTVEELIVNGNNLTVNTNDADAAVLAGRNEGTISNVDMVLENLTTLTAADNAGLLAGYSSGIVRDCEVSAPAVTVNAKNGGGLIGSVEGTANAKAEVSGCKLTLTGDLTVSGTGNAGGLIGNAEHLSLTAGEPLVSLKKVTATGENAGGLIGCAKDTDIKITDADNAVTVTADSITNSNGTAAGVLGSGTNVTANSVDVTVGTIRAGKVAAGFLGTGTNVDASFCDVVIKPNSSISGTDVAAGMAGTIGPQSVFNLCTVTLTDVTVSATAGNAPADAERNAAGYAVEIAAEAEIRNSSVTLGGSAKIEASNNAAGYACAVAGYVGNASGSAVSSSVVGHGTITGKNAAGFACDITGQVASSFVTPALNSGNYRGNSNDNLKVIASENAAGFALTVGQKATVTNCYALNKIVAKSEGAKLAGFVRTNKGEITGCMANVTLNGGYAFVEKNEGVVSRSYGWYDHADGAAVPVAHVDGKFYSCYFADLKPADKEGPVAVLYTFEGDKKEGLTASDLQASINLLAGNGLTWQKPDGYEAYPYTVPEKTSDYLYPMLRTHYGDWLTPPMYAYGVAYYEVYSTVSTAAETTEGAGTTDGTTSAPATGTKVKLHMVDLSDPTLTEEGRKGKNANYSDTFDNEGTIVDTGYAVFRKSGNKAALAEFAGDQLTNLSYTLELDKDTSITYDFFKLIDSSNESNDNGVVTIEGTPVQTWFADAINVTDNTYQVRTPAQLANVAQSAAASLNFNQTHDITVNDFTTVANLNGSYTGNGLTLTVSDQKSTWITTVGGSVTGLNLNLSGGVNAPVFGTVSQGANVTLSGLKIGAVGAEGALATTVDGTMTVPAISTPAVNGKLFGDSDGTINTDAITVGTTDTDGKRIPGAVTQLFGDVANVTVNGAIETGTVSGKLFDDVSGTVSTGAINVTGTAAQVFGNVTGGSVTVNGGITTAGAAQIFGTVGAEVAVTGLITTGDLTGNAITAANAKMTLNGITVGDVPAGSYVIAGFGNGANEVKTGDVTVTKNIAGNVFGDVNGTVKIGAVTTKAVANIFGNVTGGSLTMASINTKANAVSGNVFGNVSATVIVGTVAEDKTVTGGPITTGDVSGNVFGDINMEAGEAVQVGGITVGNVTNTLVKSITTAAAAGDKAAGSVSLGAVSTLAIVTPAQGETAAKPVGLFGTISGSGTVTVASVNTNGNAVTGNVFTTVGGTLNVTDGITTGAVTGNIFTEITGGTVTTGAINVASLNGKLATSVGGTLQGSAAGTAVNIGEDGTANLTQDLVGTVSGSLKNYAVKAADVSASVVGTLGEKGDVTSVSITADSAGNAPVLVKSNGGDIVSCTVEVASVEATDAAAPYGVMADQVKADKKIENSFVKVGTLTIDGNTAQFGALVGTNAGALTGNTVDSNEADKSLALNVTGVNDKEPVIGGLVGQNTGTVSGGTVDVAITYTQSNTTDDQGNVTATDKGATIGGLVGENSGTIGVADTVTKVKGAVNLTKKNDGQSRAYVIGGAVGNAQSGVTNTTANVKVDAEWAGAPNKEGSATFGSSGITNNGPVGMFVGYAAGVTFTKCESTAANDTYQFIGEATVGTQTIEGKYWTTNKGVKTLTAYDETEPYGEDDSYVSIEDESVSLNKAPSSVNKVSTVFENCTFMLGSTQRTQTLGAKDFYYTQGEPQWQKAFSSGEALKVSFESAGNQKFSVNGGNSQALTDTTLYYKTGTSYVRAYWKCDYKKGSWFLDPGTYTFTLCDANGNALTAAKEGTYEGVWEGYNLVTKYYAEFELHSIKEPALSAAYYLVVTDDGLAVDKNGNTSAIVKEFLQKDDFFTYVYSCTDMKLDGLTVTAINSSAQSYGATDAMKYTVGSLSAGAQKNFMLYPLTVNDQAYQLLTFSWDTDAYRDQYVTYSPMDNTKAISEETLPAEEIGGETGNNT